MVFEITKLIEKRKNVNLYNLIEIEEAINQIKYFGEIILIKVHEIDSSGNVDYHSI